jgi:hypothetical protein
MTGWKAWLGAPLAALAGAAVVLAVFGLGPLNPHNQGWLLAGPLGPDPVQLWLGWSYFRASPWLLPPGANPDYGMELGTAIYFADAIPLLALVLKALRGVVEVPQYVGPWLLACGVLQGVLGWRLVGLATRNPLARVCGAGLLALQPMLINRMAGHTPLAGQWVLLAALLLALGRGQGAWHALRWAALLAVTALIHSYLLAMALPLWAADWLRRAWLARGRALVAEAVAVPLAVAGALWTGGFFLLRGGYGTGPGSEAGGYGTWNFDLLAYADGGLWSGLLPDLPDPGHWEAGSSYLGLGGLLLLAAGLVALLRRPVGLPRRLWPLAAALLALLAFAITPNVTIGGRGGELFALPDRAMVIAGMLRNAERMVWPLSYVLMLGAIALAARAWGGRRTGWLLLGLLALQWVDLQPGIERRHSFVAGAPTGVPQRLFDPFGRRRRGPMRGCGRCRRRIWGRGGSRSPASPRRPGCRRIPSTWREWTRAGAAALRAKVAEVLRSGAYEPGTLYILRDAESLALAEASHDPARDAILTADGYRVLAPGWRARPLARR